MSTLSLSLYIYTVLVCLYPYVEAFSSCKEVYLSKNRNNSGEYVLYHNEKPVKVYCFFEGYWVYTFISKSSYNTPIDMSKLYTARNFAKIRIRWNNGTQNEVTVENLTGYQNKSDLYFGYNNHTSYQGPQSKNADYMSPYLFLGFLPISLTRDKTIQGYRAGDRDFTFRNCDANPNSYITFYFNPNSSHPRRVGNSDIFMTGWMDYSSLIDNSLSMGSEFYFDFEMHMGGCGGFMTSYSVSNIKVALGLPSGLLTNSAAHEEDIGDMGNTGMIIGLVIGLVLLICVGVVAVIFIKRYIVTSEKRDIFKNDITSDDYTIPTKNDQSHEYHTLENSKKPYMNVASVSGSRAVSNSEYDYAANEYVDLDQIGLGNRESNNDQYEVVEQKQDMK
ncbi:uncharacterized protein LOC127710087 [Mytilus californianus]|uniref:uncharacterized protein LOC127710087 n=1 Tax=Mytilus californianus TaxID=6549 RepID=UPI00224733DD|nr:uncharacterized protein LOC127710087 [Mytilus californianus]XP_052071795.1 uncharacterized protein LOC127710087 [Mytilus californianus]